MLDILDTEIHCQNADAKLDIFVISPIDSDPTGHPIKSKLHLDLSNPLESVISCLRCLVNPTNQTRRTRLAGPIITWTPSLCTRALLYLLVWRLTHPPSCWTYT